ncbi:conserved exported protein of unknown function [Nitrospira moscoviensis]|uniref:Coenzyme Q-binding protein COQ10 START domain-containing protein n=1 Tax=Nitrospira moscoviensis TaxID=42253 RepID=A0A0K2GHU2_NITMO|nr:conserved exported protein of unknown function [Nitrospira moscoviensis]
MIPCTVLSRRALILVLATAVTGSCTGASPDLSIKSTIKEVHAMKDANKMIPPVSSFTSAPLRNRLRVELKAPVSEVWALIGDLSRFPEYSSGLEKVVATHDASGALTEYVCHFKPGENNGEGISHREKIRWYEPNRGYASSGEEGNAFGLSNDLNLVAVEPSEEGTILTWDEYYDAEDLDSRRADYDQALMDIGEHLRRRFGGAIVGRYVDR